MILLLVPLATSAQTITIDCLPEDCGGLCYSFTSPYPSGTLNNWDFGDGTIISTTDLKVTHCYTNVDTYNSINSAVHITLNATGQAQLEETLDHSTCQSGVFVGATDGTSTTYLSEYSVLPGSIFDGLNHTQNVFVYAPAIIDKPFEFKDVDIYMRPEAGFDHTLPYVFSLNNSNITTNPGCSCQWRGILVSNGVFNCNNSSIQNATFGVFYRDGFQVQIRNSNLINNYIGLAAIFEPGQLFFNLTFTGNTISSTGALPDYCGGGIFNNPYIFSENTFDNTRGYAGIYFTGISTTKIGDKLSNQNTFSNLANGIILNDCSIGQIDGGGNITNGIANCRFINILRGTYPAAIGGHGIRFNAVRPGHFLRQEGSGQFNLSNPTFESCEIGIKAYYPSKGENTSIISFNNRMTNMETGYWLSNLTNTIEAEIYSNYIQSNQFYGNGYFNGSSSAHCILAEFGSQTPETKISIHNNTLYSDQDLTVVSCIRLVKDYMDDSTEGIIEISDNNINLLKRGHGISNYDLSSSIIRNNIISISDSEFYNGILIGDGENNYVMCNDIYGPQPEIPPISTFSKYGINNFLATTS
jgi:hypothetical protein